MKFALVKILNKAKNICYKKEHRDKRGAKIYFYSFLLIGSQRGKFNTYKTIGKKPSFNFTYHIYYDLTKLTQLSITWLEASDMY